MEFFFLIGLLLVAVPFVLPIAAWVSARRTRARIDALESLVEQQRADLYAVNQALKQLRREPDAPARQPAAPVATATEPMVVSERLPYETSMQANRARSFTPRIAAATPGCRTAV